MTFRNRWLFIAFIIVSVLGLLFQWREHNRIIAGDNRSGILCSKIETLYLVHVQRNCTCPDWIEVARLKRAEGPGEEDYFYLEPGAKDVEIGSKYPAYTESGYLLRLRGSFYLEKGVPAGRVGRADQNPEMARVFRYTSSDLIKPE